jgi:hypothetical protein
MSLLAGESVGLIDEIRPAAEVLRETISGAERCAGPFGRSSAIPIIARVVSPLGLLLPFFPFRDVLRIDARAEMHFGLFSIPAVKYPKRYINAQN